MKDAELREILKQLLESDTQNSSRIVGGHTLPLLLYLKDRLESRGARVALQEYSVSATIAGKPIQLGDRGNLLVTVGSEKPVVLLQGHVDTVPDASQFRPKVCGEFAVGRGAVDMKGPVAGLVRAFEILLAKKEELSFVPVLLLTSDEESHNFVGIKKFLEEPLLDLSDVEFGICAEPSDMRVKKHLYGAIYFLVRTGGTQHHSSVICEGNAIERAAPVLSSLVKLRKRLAGRLRDGFGGSILGIGLIRGGEKVNQAPKSCEIHVVIRNAEPAEAIKDILKEEILSGPAADAEVAVIFAYDPVVVKLTLAHEALIERAFAQNQTLWEFAQ